MSLIIGGRLGYVFIYNPGFFWENPQYIYQFWTGGMSFHGAAVACVITNIWYAGTLRKFLTFSDLVCQYLPIALFLGRLGNFINGELWGRPSNVPWAVIFPSGGDISRHPSQLYEALGEGLLLFVFLKFLLKNPVRGLVTTGFIGGYGTIRFFLEFFREPDSQLGFFGPLTMGQILCLVMISFSLFLYRTIFGHRQ